jgi:hypothetical protein
MDDTTGLEQMAQTTFCDFLPSFSKHERAGSQILTE